MTWPCRKCIHSRSFLNDILLRWCRYWSRESDSCLPGCSLYHIDKFWIALCNSILFSNCTKELNCMYKTGSYLILSITKGSIWLPRWLSGQKQIKILLFKLVRFYITVNGLISKHSLFFLSWQNNVYWFYPSSNQSVSLSTIQLSLNHLATQSLKHRATQLVKRSAAKPVTQPNSQCCFR